MTDEIELTVAKALRAKRIAALMTLLENGGAGSQMASVINAFESRANAIVASTKNDIQILERQRNDIQTLIGTQETLLTSYNQLVLALNNEIKENKGKLRKIGSNLSEKGLILDDIANGKKPSKFLNAAELLALFGDEADKWQVLTIDEEQKRALLMTRDCVQLRLMGARRYQSDNRYEVSALRKWLTRDFFKSLPSIVKDKVIATQISLAKDKKRKKVYDNIFILDDKQVRKYLKVAEARTALYQGKGVGWWLRPSEESALRHVSANGRIVTGTGDHHYGVRPAIWLDTSVGKK